MLLAIFFSFDKTQWKHVAVGFFNEKSDRAKSLNLLIAYVAYWIYEQKMPCRLDSKMKLNVIYKYNHVKNLLVFLLQLYVI